MSWPIDLVNEIRLTHGRPFVKTIGEHELVCAYCGKKSSEPADESCTKTFASCRHYREPKGVNEWCRQAGRPYFEERERQIHKWGHQRHGFGSFPFNEHLVRGRLNMGEITWANILMEELAEAENATCDEDRIKELTQATAVLMAWIHDLKTNGR